MRDEEELMKKALLGELAPLLTYPEGDYHERCLLCRNATASAPRAAVAELAEFIAEMERMTTPERQECFVRTFDFNPDCALEIGWHLFGEDYKRGQMLAFLRGEMRSAGVDEGSELPDHLCSVLRLLGRWESEDSAEFAGKFLNPALEKLENAVTQSGGPYLHLIRAVRTICRCEFDGEHEGETEVQTAPGGGLTSGVTI